LGLIIKWGFVVWFLAEIAAFAVLVAYLGLGLTVLLGFATTCIGFMMLGKANRETLRQLNARDEGGFTLVLLGPARILAAILLILPGFLTDLIGIFLAIPLFGQLFSSHVSRRYAARNPDVLDLDATEWRAAEEKPTHPTALPRKF
jgi:UPF0716 protein FxsA